MLDASQSQAVVLLLNDEMQYAIMILSPAHDFGFEVISDCNFWFLMLDVRLSFILWFGLRWFKTNEIHSFRILVLVQKR